MIIEHWVTVKMYDPVNVQSAVVCFVDTLLPKPHVAGAARVVSVATYIYLHYTHVLGSPHLSSIVVEVELPS